ncbi:glycosyltransferase family 4 protein [Luteolibacter marinus]|uniref:glycosyltransferase family 4 protein n=1 Tax=Luteolibacter marinus TaxID=2776705 RepID=UPI0018667C99|nr:glycosyltransferase family 4 protein [Luteolibacter marinus]
MKIAMLSWESLHSIPVGGGAVHVTELAAALERRGHEVHVFTRLGEGQSTSAMIDGVKYHRCPIELDPDFITETNNMGNSLIYFLGATEAADGVPFDIVHGHDWLCSKALAQAKNDRGRKVVFTIHSTQFGRTGNNLHTGVCDRIRAIEREGTFVADRVIAVSGYLADEVKWQYEVPEWKLRVVYNGIECSRFDGEIDPAVCRRSYGVGPLDPMILYVGRISTQKGPDLLLEAMPSILRYQPGAKAVFVGDGDMRSHLEHRARELGVNHAVRFPGAMGPDSDVLNLFKSTDVVCVPSRNEPFGIVVLEAWAASKPVVVTRNGGPRDFVSHGEDGYLVDATAAGIADGVKAAFSNFEHARWMGSRGRVKAAYGFSWDGIAEQTEAIYREILPQPLPAEAIKSIETEAAEPETAESQS